MKKAIILAAGRGMRLRKYHNKPKCLLKFGNQQQSTENQQKSTKIHEHHENLRKINKNLRKSTKILEILRKSTKNKYLIMILLRGFGI